MTGFRAVVAAVLVAVATTACTASADNPPAAADDAARAGARAFLESYVEPDGRVVRRDQGGDTVSEGQAYALLLATAAGDHDRVTRVWRWTAANLRRPDGLLSWRWVGGKVEDPNSATDADLDAARALVLAGDRFVDPALAADGRTLARAVLDHATVEVAGERVLVAGNWATTAPYRVNPSYLSPAATTLLRRATEDPRWDEVARTGRAQLRSLLATGDLPPDWAQVDDRARVTPTALDPNPVQYGLDAARVAPRFAESCAAEDRTLAAGAAPTEDFAAVHALDGTPRADWQHPLTLVAAAAADPSHRADLLARAAELDRETPTYYGAAWAALGPVLLTTTLLAPCG